MPELPEIALQKKYVDSTSLHKKITHVSLHNAEKLLQVSGTTLRKALEGNELQKTERLGKYLFLKIDKKQWLVLHFGMTGDLAYYKNQDMPAYSKMVLSFENHYHLAFINKRKLGKISFTDSVENFQKENNIGTDALEIDWDSFQKLLPDKKGSIKSFLMDQHEIAGIGNIYADEILYQCKIHPISKISKISEKELRGIYNQIEIVLKTVIDHDAKRSELPSDYLAPHRKEGANCPACSGKVEKIKVGGRSTYFCPACQKEK